MQDCAVMVVVDVQSSTLDIVGCWRDVVWSGLGAWRKIFSCYWAYDDEDIFGSLFLLG